MLQRITRVSGATCRSSGGQAALDRLAQRLNMQSGSLNQRDDLTVVCLSVTEPAAISAQDAPSAANAA